MLNVTTFGVRRSMCNVHLLSVFCIIVYFTSVCIFTRSSTSQSLDLTMRAMYIIFSFFFFASFEAEEENEMITNFSTHPRSCISNRIIFKVNTIKARRSNCENKNEETRRATKKKKKKKKNKSYKHELVFNYSL